MARNLGMVTAYAYAVAGGYTGTEAEFEELLGNIADDLSQIENLSVTVTTLTPGSSATASYSNGVLALGIPRGNTGATGNGISAIIKTGTSGLVDTYTVTYTNGQTMTYTVTNGAKGDTGNGIASIALTSTSGAVKTYTVTFTDGSTFTFDVTDGEVTNESLAEALEDFSANGTVANAEQLTTDIRANDQTPYLFRTAGGSVDIGDREYINGIVGGTVAWNQLVRSGNFDSTTPWTATGGTISVADNVLSFTVGTPGGIGNQRINNNGSGNFPRIAGHKYLSMVEVNYPKVATEARLYPAGGLYNRVNINSVNTWIAVNLITSETQSSATGMSQFMFGDLSTAGYEGGEVIKVRNFRTFDLTQMFGSTIADYIYSLEQATAGAGVAFFKTLGFNKPYYAYNAGELMSVGGLVSHDMVGFNAFDKSTATLNKYIDGNGVEQPSGSGVCHSALIRVVPNTTYYTNASATSLVHTICLYDESKNFIKKLSYSAPTTFNTENASYVVLNTASSQTSIDNLVLNISWDGSEDGEYEPYQKWSYPLDSDLELRGVPKLENGNLYYDGDTYESDGTVTRKYGIVDLGTLDWVLNSGNQFYANLPQNAKSATAGYLNVICPRYPAKNVYSAPTTTGICTTVGSVWLVDPNYTSASAIKASLDGVYFVYELATPTTETADPYTNPQIVNDFGTEEFVISNTVDVPIPVGHDTDYPVDLKAKVEMAPNSPDGDGDYIVRQTNGTNEYVALANNATIQNILARLTALEG